jgi:hypothetical protein
MNVDEMLRERGDQWQAPAVGGPDLHAALGRSAGRNRATRVAVAVLAVLAVGGTAWVAFPVLRDVPAIPAPAITPPDPTQSTSGPAAATPTKDQLAEVARTLRADFRYSFNNDAKTVDVVGSTVGSVAAASVLSAPQGTEASAAVWVMQLEADFRCDTCRHPKGKVARQPILRALVRDDLEVIAVGTFDKPADLGSLGRVSTLSLAVKGRGFDEEVIRQSIRRNLAALDAVTLTDDIATRTTLWRTQERLLGTAQNPRSYRSVWIVFLDGSFTCSTCVRIQGAGQGTALVMVIDASSGDLDFMAISSAPIDQRNLAGRGDISWVTSVLR